MKVFIIGTPLETAIALDGRRLNKQIVETQQILDALNGKKVCEFLEPPLTAFIGSEDAKEFIAEFRQAMEGGAE